MVISVAANLDNLWPFLAGMQNNTQNVSVFSTKKGKEEKLRLMAIKPFLLEIPFSFID